MTENSKRTEKHAIEKGNVKTGLGKMWVYFLVWVGFIALGIVAMANSDASPIEDTANKKIEKKEAGNKDTSMKNAS